MDISIRRNEHCIIGLPRCDFVFSSTRTCFIAYGFKASSFEMAILRNILQSKGIQCEEAGGQLAPGQYAFCQKICSKIITSQFSIIILNKDSKDGQLVPNANVNMEYGLMLGFNKYLIPFQLESQELPFNVAALDTVKYNSQNFEHKASEAIDVAIDKTNQDLSASYRSPDQLIELFLVSKKALYAFVEDDVGNKEIFRLGSPLGFNLLHDFSGMVYIFLGNFMALRPDITIWRLKMLNDILNERRASLGERLKIGIINLEQVRITTSLFDSLKIWILVTSEEDKQTINNEILAFDIPYSLEIFSKNDINAELDNIIKK